MGIPLEKGDGTSLRHKIDGFRIQEKRRDRNLLQFGESGMRSFSACGSTRGN
jgi:hypothetical protein